MAIPRGKTVEGILERGTCSVPEHRPPAAPLLPGLLRLQRHDTRVGILLLTVLLLNGADLACSLFAERIGMLQEQNPLADSFLRVGLLQSFVAFKILMVLCGSLMLWRARRSKWSVPACWVLIVAYAALAVLWYLWISDINYAYEIQQSAGRSGFQPQ